MLRWHPPKPNLMSSSIRGAIRVDHARWITMRPVAPIASVRAGHYLCTGDLLQLRRDDVDWIVLASSKRHAPNCCSNCGLEMGVCRTSWKRVSCAQRDARAAQGAAERMAKDLNARLDLVSAIPERFAAAVAGDG
jgi:hypothetical protein